MFPAPPGSPSPGSGGLRAAREGTRSAGRDGPAGEAAQNLMLPIMLATFVVS